VGISLEYNCIYVLCYDLCLMFCYFSFKISCYYILVIVMLNFIWWDVLQ
jgi:hypothetical protein